jgi:hypothetical protein
VLLPLDLQLTVVERPYRTSAGDVGDELSSCDEAVDTEGVVVVDLVDLVRDLPNEGQLVLDSLGFGSEHIVARGKFGLHEVRVSIVSLHLLTSLSGYFGELDAFSKLLSFDKDRDLLVIGC